MNITKKEATQIINDCFYAIPYIGYNFSDISKEMLQKCVESEKKHRVGRSPIKGFSTTLAAKYFMVKHLFEGRESLYSVNDVLYIRIEALYGQAFAYENKEKLKPFFDFVENSKFFEIDYSDMMK